MDTDNLAAPFKNLEDARVRLDRESHANGGFPPILDNSIRDELLHLLITELSILRARCEALERGASW